MRIPFLCCVLLSWVGTLAHAQLTVTTQELVLGTGRLDYSNRADVSFAADGSPVVIYAEEDQGTYIQQYHPGTPWQPAGDPLFYKDLIFMDFQVVDDAYYFIAKGGKGFYTEGPTQITNYENILYFVKTDRSGRVLLQRPLLGDAGNGGGTYFLCSMSGRGQLRFDGQYFHVFSESCINIDDSGYDIHQGDAYFVLDQHGNPLPEGKHLFTSSHSSLLQLATGQAGQGYTLTVGDSNPWGMHFFQYQAGKQQARQVIFPDQNRLPYADMYAATRSTTGAGEIGGLVSLGGYLYTIIASVPVGQHPVLDQPKDLLFVKFRPDGTVVDQHWLGRTPTVDESVPHLTRIGNQLLVAYMHKVGQYEWDYKVHYAQVTQAGEYAGPAMASELYMDFQSRFFRFPNGDPGFLGSAPYANTVQITRWHP